jgi:hypothetical protein
MNVDRPFLAARGPARLILALGAALSPACAAAPEQATGSPSLVGAWRSDCTPLGKGGRHGAVFEVRFDAQGRMLARTRMFARSDCAAPTLEVAAVAAYQLGASSGAGVAIDFAFERVEMTPQAQEVADIYNSEPFARCARREWRVGRPQSVMGGFCPPTRMPGRGVVHRDAAFFRDDTVAFGFMPLGLEAARGGERPRTPSAVAFRRLR